MSKIDKKVLVIFFIFALILISFNPIIVNAADEENLNINSNPALENDSATGVEIIQDRVLLSNGTLWRVNQDLTTTYEDNKVKSIGYIYKRANKGNYSYYLKLKNDNKLYVDITNADDNSRVLKTATISNVKQLSEQDINHYDYISYLTKDNSVYCISPLTNYPEVIEPDFINRNVDKMLGNFYIKDGVTFVSNVYEENPSEWNSYGNYVCFEIDKAKGNYCSHGTELYYVNEDYGYFTNRANDFLDFAYKENKHGNIKYYTTTKIGKVIGVSEDGIIHTEYIWNSSKGSYTYSLDTKGNMYYNGEDYRNLLMLTNVVDIVKYEDIIMAVRSDGTVWANMLGDVTNFKKVISTKSFYAFKDVDQSNWYYNAAKYVYTNNIMSGINDTTFGANNKLTRGMLATIIHKMEKNPNTSGTSKFSDVKDSSKYYYKAVIWASENKIVSGYKDGSFGPNDYITREQLAVILYNYAKYKGKNMTKTDNLKAFSDSDKVASYATTQVKWAVANGIITGSNGKLNPKGNATRAETAAMIQKYYKNIGK